MLFLPKYWKKKIFFIGIFCCLFFISICSSVVCFCAASCDPETSFFCNPLRGTVGTLVEGGEKMTGYILGLIGSVALLLIIISGIMYITSAGNEEKIASSKKILTGSVVGLAIALLAFSLLQVLLSILNM